MPYWRDSWRGVVTRAIPLRCFRDTDATYDDPLTATAGTAMCLTGGTHGTDSPKLRSDAASGNVKTSKARVEFVLPPEYVPGGEITIRIHAKTTPKALGSGTDGTSTLDVQVFKSDRETTVGAELYAGAALDINVSTFADKDYALDATEIGSQSLAPGDTLDIEVTAVVTDTGGTSNSRAIIGSVQVLLMERF